MSRDTNRELSAQPIIPPIFRIVCLAEVLILVCSSTPAWGQQPGPTSSSVQAPRMASARLEADSPTLRSPTSSLTAIDPEVAGGADSTPDDPPAAPSATTSPGAAGPPRSFGPPPPPLFAMDGWLIGESGLSGIDSRFSMSYLSLSHGRQFRKGFTSVNIRPQFQTLFLGGPTGDGPRLPEQVYGLTLDLQVDQPLSRKFSLQLGVTPGLYTDFRNLSGESIRVPARLFGSYFFGPKLIVLGGLVYTAQPNLPFIPAAGFIWSPSERWRFEMIAPRPRIVFKASDRLQVYTLFSFDSSTYAVESMGRDELMQYRDFRVAMGTEWTTEKKQRFFSEVGAAFSRRLDLEHQADRNVDPGVFVRAGLRF